MRRTKEEAQQTRDSVLRAATQIIVRHGMNAFTIEAVAQEAGVTKGGVLHHFPSKEALVDGMLDQVIQSFNQRLTAELKEEEAEQPGRWLRAYIRSVFSMQYEDRNIIPALAAAFAADHHIVDRIRVEMEKSQQAAIDDQIDPITATIVRLAVDGIVFSRALGLDVLVPETGKAVQEALLRLTHTSTEGE